MQSVVSGVMVVMMVIDLHKGVWREEEQECDIEAGRGLCWMRHCMRLKQQFKRGEHDEAYRNGRSSGKHSSPHVY